MRSVPPNIQVRHGYFNLQETNQSGFHIQRDVFNENGLEAISDNRMTSIKVSDKNITHFGILDKTGFKSKSKRFSTIRLKANRATSIKVESRNLIFSEFDEFVVDGVKISKQQAVIKNQSGIVKLTSTEDQYLIIYNV